MNQTNFGFNPQRQTIAPNEALLVEPLASGRGDRQLNTQKRNRTHTIQVGEGQQRVQSRGNSLNFQDLYSNYQGVAVNGAPSSRQGHHAPGQKQIFLPGTMKAQARQRKAPVTQHQQHRSQSHGANSAVNNNNQVQINYNA